MWSDQLYYGVYIRQCRKQLTDRSVIMSEITAEQHSELPDFMKESYVADGEGFSHGGFLKVKGTANELDRASKLSASALEETRGKLTAFEANQAEALEAARSEAHDKAVKEGNIEGITERHNQQMEDAMARSLAEGRSLAQAEYAEKAASQRADSLADNIGLSLGIDKDGGEVIAELIKSRVKVDAVTGQEIYHDASGSALSIDKDGFIAELKKEKRFARLIKAEFTTVGGGLSEGSGKGGSATTPDSLEACKGNKKLEAAYFTKQLLKG